MSETIDEFYKAACWPYRGEKSATRTYQVECRARCFAGAFPWSQGYPKPPVLPMSPGCISVLKRGMHSST